MLYIIKFFSIYVYCTNDHYYTIILLRNSGVEWARNLIKEMQSIISWKSFVGDPSDYIGSWWLLNCKRLSLVAHVSGVCGWNFYPFYFCRLVLKESWLSFSSRYDSCHASCQLPNDKLSGPFEWASGPDAFTPFFQPIKALALLSDTFASGLGAHAFDFNGVYFRF